MRNNIPFAPKWGATGAVPAINPVGLEAGIFPPHHLAHARLLIMHMTMTVNGQAVVEILAEAGDGPAPAMVAVCGSKNVGKSTFARLLVNSLLNAHPHVAFLDIDCGQPEFTCPGKSARMFNFLWMLVLFMCVCTAC